MDEQNFKHLCDTLTKIDLLGHRKPEPPWGATRPRTSVVSAAVRAGRALVPSAYCEGFVDPLESKLPELVEDHAKDPSSPKLETLAGAIYQHAADYTLAPHLRRFLAVVSDLYRSFLDKKKRADARFPVREYLPPLATFKYLANPGPFTMPVNEVHKHIGGSVGIVSLPATYAEDPILWATLAHETGGHDVVHADAGLLEELQHGLGHELVETSVTGLSPSQLVSLWSHWMDEAAADVYGLLNIGPTFAAGAAAYFAALRHKRGFPIPKIAMESAHGDAHPTDILRIHLAVGVVMSLDRLAADTRDKYVADLKHLATLCASGDTVEISGYSLFDGEDTKRTDAVMPLADMQKSARHVGRYIATARLTTLGNHRIQDIETWDDDDEARADGVRAALAAGRPIGALGDDAQLLAGAIMHLLKVPDDYQIVRDRLAEGLNQSFATDPIWNEH